MQFIEKLFTRKTNSPYAIGEIVMLRGAPATVVGFGTDPNTLTVQRAPGERRLAVNLDQVSLA